MGKDDLILGNLIASKARTDGERTFFIWEDRSYTYTMIDRESTNIAASLAALGLKKGDEVCTFMCSSPEYIYLWVAMSKLGVVEIPINYSFKGQLITDLVSFVEAKTIITDEVLYPTLAAVMETLKKIDRVIICGNGPIVEMGRFEYIRFDELRKISANPVEVHKKYWDLSTIMFTSGTTGTSKGALQSHYQQGLFAIIWKDIIGCKENDVLYNFFPFYHIAARFLAYTCILTGAKFILRERFSIKSFWPDVEKYGVTIFFAIGGICHMIYSQQERPRDRTNPIRLVYAVPVPVEIKKSFDERFSVKFCEAYGTTETNLVLHTNIGEETPTGSCGKPDPHFDVRIFDENDMGLPPGKIGEIVVRPKEPYSIFQGYYKHPVQSLDIMRNLWIHMGDAGYRDEEGFFYFVDRKKDSIRRRGENISSYEIERVLNRHPAIGESAVIAVPSDLQEDDVKAFIRLREGKTIDVVELIKYCFDNMAYFMVPRYIEISEEFPRTPTGKVQKFNLREMGSKGITSSTWDRENAGIKVTHKGIYSV